MEKSKTLSMWPYIAGFILSVLLTFSAYEFVVNHYVGGVGLIAIIVTLAITQLIVQLVFFLHLGRGKEAKWNLAAFLFMLMILVILVAGSLWIMYNLNYNMMSPDQMNSYMQAQSKAGF
ncbi:MAG TPA: cytochrome o ubiquinol oxidase subunit IV [Candidatus Chromulinivoraceae bacterium]|nr:cytochrome o ubiquinol oxidase subunit IV [Candidatus Chromulinivoraceae bacterium]